MKIGITTYSFMKYVRQTGCGYRDICDITKEIGFDGIEFINLNRVMDCADEMAEARGLRAYCEKIGLEIVAYTVAADFLAEDTAAEMARVRGDVDIAAALGAKLMRHDVATGPRKVFGYGYKDAIAEIAPRVREITEYARQKGIKTCSENHGRFFQAPRRVKELIDAVNHPNYGWLIDVGNFMGVDADIVEAVAIAAPYAVHVHAKDNLFKPGTEIAPEGWSVTTGGNYLRATVPGHGVVPLRQCVNIVRQAGYNGYVSLEFEGWEDSLQALKSGYAYLRGIVTP